MRDYQLRWYSCGKVYIGIETYGFNMQGQMSLGYSIVLNNEEIAQGDSQVEASYTYTDELLIRRLLIKLLDEGVLNRNIKAQLTLDAQGEYVVINDFLLTEQIEMSKYVNGRCQIFALALHLELGYEIEFLYDEEAEFEDEEGEEVIGEALDHAFCINPEGRCFDIRGEIDKEKLPMNYNTNEPYFKKETEVSIEKRFEEDFIDRPKEGEIEQLRDFIRMNQRHYL